VPGIQVQQPPPGGDIRRDGLLADDVLPGGERLFHHGWQRVDRHNDVHRLDVVAGQQRVQIGRNVDRDAQLLGQGFG